MAEPGMVLRNVVSSDPNLSDRANELLTRDLRSVIGANAIEVPVEVAERGRRRQTRRTKLIAGVIEMRYLVIITIALLAAVAAIVSTGTNKYWALYLAFAIHLPMTAWVAVVTFRLTGAREHVSPETAAQLEQEGVGDADRIFTELLAEYQ